MDDFYTEQLIKKQADSKGYSLRNGTYSINCCVSAFGFCYTGGNYISSCDDRDRYIDVPQSDVEYEYLFVNGDLDIDKIMNKARRKRCFL